MNRIKVYRYLTTSESTLGLMYINNQFFGYTLEDTKRNEKLPGETRIPKGIYKLKIQETDTPLTLKYRKKYPWFNNHIHIDEIPGYRNVYIHVGNTAKDTAGCLLLGTGIGPNQITQSIPCFQKFYEMIYPKLQAKEEYEIEFIELEDNAQLQG